MKVAIIALSSGLGKIFPHILDLAVKNYKLFFDIDCKFYKTINMYPEEIAENPKLRAQELNKAFLDDDILFVNALIGGDDSIRILDYIDIENANKYVVGFSDATQYLSHLAINNKKAIYGACALAGIAQMHNFSSDFFDMMKKVLFTNESFTYPIFKEYAEGYMDWSKEDNNGELLELKPTKGPLVLNGKGIVKGKLWGGCIESIEQMKQTKYFPSKEYLKDKILFLETSEEKPSPEQVKRILYNYCIGGIFDNIKALIFGIPNHYTEIEKETLNKYIIDVIVNEYNYDIPIVVNCPFGHTVPSWFLPYNETLEIDLNNIRFNLIRT